MSASTTSRRGGCIGRLFTLVGGLVVLAGLAYLGWFAFVNQTVDPRTLSEGERHREAINRARPLADAAGRGIAQASEAVARLADEAWRDGGLVDQASDWLRGNPAPETPAPATPAPPTATIPAVQEPGTPVPEPSSITIKRETDLVTARQHFESGLVLYRRANPADAGWTEARKAAILQARDEFVACRDLLARSLESYEQAEDHNPTLARESRELQSLNQRLLANATKMAPGL